VECQIMRSLFEFLTLTGLRIGEAGALSWEDVDSDDRQMTVVSNDNHRTKSGKKRVVPLVEEALGVLPPRNGDDLVFVRNGKPIRPEYASKYFRKCCRKAGLPDAITLHSTRHTLATNLIKGNVSLYLVGKILGHKNPDLTTKLYEHIAPSDLHSAMSVLSRRRIERPAGAAVGKYEEGESRNRAFSCQRPM
ncbi:MAG: tyrosine-type recombinase/integrase, partial [Bacteroidota bacterium]